MSLGIRAARVAGRAILVALAPLIICSAASSTAGAEARKPAAPGRLAAKPGPGGVALSWTRSRGDVTAVGYHVWRKRASSGGWTRIKTVSGPAHTDRAAIGGRRYTYGVRAYDAAGHISSSSTLRTVRARATATARPADAGRVVWKADAEGAFEEEWASMGSSTHCDTKAYRGLTDTRISRSSMRAKGLFSYRTAIRDGDSCYGERAEMSQGNPIRTGFYEDRLFRAGDERWISWQVRLGSGFPINANTWQLVAQWKQLGSLGTPVLSMEARQGQWQLANSPADPRNRSHHRYSLGAAKVATWTRFTMHVKFSPDPRVGFVELFGDVGDGRGMRTLFGRRALSTLRVDPGKRSATVPSHARLGIYRNPAVSGATEVLYDGYTVATSRAAAEANAF